MENKIKRGVGLTILVLAVNAFVSYKATRSLINDDQWVRHSYEVIVELDATLSTLKDAETGERGFIITGASDYLGPYSNAVAQVDDHIQKLKQLAADNPPQEAQIPVLQAKVAARIATLKEAIDLRQSGNIGGANALVATGIGKQMMDDVRAFIGAMTAEENRLLEVRTEESRASQRSTIATFILANLIAVAILLLTTTLTLSGIRARRRREDELSEQRQFLEVTLSSIADAVVACDRKGFIIFINRVAASLTGWSTSEATGQPLTQVFKIVNEETHKPVESPTLRAIREGKIVEFANHTVLLAKDGKQIPIDDGASPIRTAEGAILGAVLIFRDMSSRRKAEDERTRLLDQAEAARETAEAANRTKDEFLAVLSHELRTPLTSVFGWVQLLQRHSVDDATRAKALEVIDRNVRAQTQIIDDLLNISQIINGKLQIRRELTDALQVVKNVVETARPSAEAKGIHIRLENDEQLPAIFVDRARLQQIAWNLVSNAVKFTPKGGSVRVSVRRIASDLQIAISDTGQGISAEFMPRVFNRFSQADASSTRFHGGLGLGLALVKQLVELHGGTVRAESEGTGRGSTFIVTFPVPGVIGGRAAPASNTENADSLKGVRVMVVEDEPDTRDMITEVLQQFGASVTQAASASEALRLFVSATAPNVLISDIGMPDMDGYQLLAAIRTRIEKPPPAIALTAFASPSDKQRAIRSGFQAHLSKPIELSTLVSTVADLVRRRAS